MSDLDSLILEYCRARAIQALAAAGVERRGLAEFFGLTLEETNDIALMLMREVRQMRNIILEQDRLASGGRSSIITLSSRINNLESVGINQHKTMTRVK